MSNSLMKLGIGGGTTVVSDGGRGYEGRSGECIRGSIGCWR
jgi:hypothetical protein